MQDLYEILHFCSKQLNVLEAFEVTPTLRTLKFFNNISRNNQNSLCIKFSALSKLILTRASHLHVELQRPPSYSEAEEPRFLRGTHPVSLNCQSCRHGVKLKFHLSASTHQHLQPSSTTFFQETPRTLRHALRAKKLNKRG